MNFNKIPTQPAESKKIKEYGKDEIKENDLVMYEGKLCRYVKKDTGYTMREYFSHHSEKGPGPGWDFRWDILMKYKVMDPSELPDEPYCKFELEYVNEDELEK